MSIWQRQFLTYHPVIGWWFIPNLKAMIPHDGDSYLVRTNSLGMRSDREYPLRRPEGRRRIVLLGDSYTAGDGVSNGERYSDRLEQFYPHLDVLNFGLPNSGTDQQLLAYEALAKPFEADAYIFAVLVENILRNQQEYRPAWEPQAASVFYRPKPYFTLEEGRLALHNRPVPLEKRSEQELGLQRPPSPDTVVTVARRLARRTLPPGLRRAIFRLLYRPNAQPYSGYESEDSYGWQLLRRILERFFEQVAGQPVFVVPLPTYHFFLANAAPIYEPTYLERFLSLEDRSCRRFVVDVLPHFLRLPPDDRQRCRGPNDPHYTPLAHTVVAQALADAMSKFCPELLTLPQRS
jgi:hypothetical protein